MKKHEDMYGFDEFIEKLIKESNKTHGKNALNFFPELVTIVQGETTLQPSQFTQGGWSALGDKKAKTIADLSRHLRKCADTKQYHSFNIRPSILVRENSILFDNQGWLVSNHVSSVDFMLSHQDLKYFSEKPEELFVNYAAMGMPADFLHQLFKDPTRSLTLESNQYKDASVGLFGMIEGIEDEIFSQGSKKKSFKAKGLHDIFSRLEK